MSDAFDPSDEDSWTGGYYEAAIILGPGNNPDADTKLEAAIQRLWSQVNLRPAALGDLRTWETIGRATFEGRPLSALHRIYGVYQSPALGALPFTSVVVREEDGEDWLYACVPLGGVPDGGGYPFGDFAESRAWREPLEHELAAMVLEICRSIPIHVAIIGFEIAGADEIAPDALKEAGSRWVGYVARYGDSYRYWPTTNWS